MLYRRKDSRYWWIKIEVNGRRIQRSAGTDSKTKAQEYHDKIKAELWNQSKLKEKPNYIWQEAAIKWLQESSHKKSIADDKMHLRILDDYLRDKTLQSVSRQEIEVIIESRRKGGVTNATINRTLALLRSILRKAMLEWEWLDKIPHIKLLPEPKKRVRWLTKEEAEQLLAELPPHLKAMAEFSLETGLRQANVTGLTWDQVDINRQCAWIHADQAKAQRAIPVPLSQNAIRIIEEQRGKHVNYVFTYLGNRVIQTSTKAWYKALSRAGIEDFRWHDLRHTWASWMVQKGVPLHALQELGGWQSSDMVAKYAHLSSEHLKTYVYKK